jgi:hypothetical protein
MDKPTVGRTVHYVAEFEGNPHCAAIINEVSEVLDHVVGLTVFWPEDAREDRAFVGRRSAAYNADHEPGTWHWPERS